MTTIDTRPDAEPAIGEGLGDTTVASFFASAAAWVTTTDHKRIGRIYLGGGIIGLLATAVLGLLLGLERADDGSALLDADALLQLFQAYRVGLVFAVIIPLTLGLSVAVAPLQVGARSIAFPRVALTGCYAWLGGLVLTMVALARNGGMGGGDATAVDLFLAGHGLMILGILASSGTVAATVLTTRAPGMTMRRVPLFAWSALVGALGVLLALPVAFGIVVYLFVDHRLGISANFGGVEGVGDWLGWIFTVPAVALFSLPAVGVAAELFPVTFGGRQVLRGVTFAGIALVGVTALAATTQQFVHEVAFDTDGQTFLEGLVPFLVFAGLPVLGLVVVLGLGGLTAASVRGRTRPRISAAFAFSFLGLGMILVGMIANFLMGITDLELIGTSMEEGATLYVVYGSALAVMGGVTFWAAKLWGRTIADLKALPLAALGVLATVLASLPLCIAGFVDLGGGVPSSDVEVGALLSLDGVDGGSIWVILSLVGHALMALTVLAFAGLLMSTVLGGDDDEQVEDNPVGGHTIEWGTASPAPEHNFEHVPTVASPEPLLVTAETTADAAADEGSAS
jgi:heme/copper-type cytochrome/quinol oxidase subunit 1